MGNLKTGEPLSIFDILGEIKNGTYVMPSFQRQYEWSMERIERLWDSILLGYPISTFLFWELTDQNVSWDTYFCDFLGDCEFNSRKENVSRNYELKSFNNKIKYAVLDGQQRLTSLYLTLYGNISVKPPRSRNSRNNIVSKLTVELDANKVSCDENEYNAKKYDFKFIENVSDLSLTRFDVKKIVENKAFYKNDDNRQKAIEDEIRYVPNESKEYAKNVLENLCKKIHDEKIIIYNLAKDTSHDDALEMFVRFNSGGMKLTKSDITMSILVAYWPNAKTQFNLLLSDEYKEFGTDFIIRAALMLYGDVVKSILNKSTVENLKNNFNNFKAALKNTKDLLKSKNINVNHFANSWNVLLPIIYLVYYNPDYLNYTEGIFAYLSRAVLFNYFRSGTTGKLNSMKNLINGLNVGLTVEGLNTNQELRFDNVNRIEDILTYEKGSKTAYETLYFLSIHWIGMIGTARYEEDHLHPYERFDKTNPPEIDIEKWAKWKTMRNRIPNLHFLYGRENGSKNDMPLIDYYNDMTKEQQDEFYEKAIIPKDVSLELKDFETFYSARKELLKLKLSNILNGKLID